MKKVLLFIAPIIVLASCSKEFSNGNAAPEQKNDLVKYEFKAEITKTHLAEDGLGVVWQANDEISIFANGVNYKFTTTDTGASATFTGEISQSDLDATTIFYALYPYEETATISGDVISTKASTNYQYAGAGTFANKIGQAVAKAQKNNEGSATFNFQNVGMLFKYTIPQNMDRAVKNLMISANNSEKFIAGNVAITVGDTPSCVGSYANFDVQSNNDDGIPAGTHYVFVYPVSLAKGLRVKLTYKDGRTPEYIFTGKAYTTERGKVMNLGTVESHPTYVYEDFENFSRWSATKETAGYKISGSNFITGNNNALSVVENPYKTETNNSDYVLVNDMHAATWATSGYVQLSFGIDAVKNVFPYAVRDKFKAIRLKAYIGTSEYYPSLQFPADGTKGNKMPSKVNGVERTDASSYASLLKHDDWNVLEFNLADCGYTSPYNSNFGNLDGCQFRPFVKSNLSNCDAALSETNLKICYIDDIEFLYK